MPKAIRKTRSKRISGNTQLTRVGLRDVLRTAPRIYVDWYQRDIDPEAGDGLQLFVTHPSMARAWREIEACNPDERFYLDLWFQANWLRFQAHLDHLPRSQQKAHYKRIANTLSYCGHMIGACSPLDLPLHQFLSGEQMATFGVPNWASLSFHKQDVAAMAGGARWPTTVDLLRSLADRANKLADDSMSKPRIAERRTRNWRERYYVRGLRNFLHERLGRPFLGTTARISRLMMENEDIDVVFVRNAAR